MNVFGNLFHFPKTIPRFKCNIFLVVLVVCSPRQLYSHNNDNNVVGVLIIGTVEST